MSSGRHGTEGGPFRAFLLLLLLVGGSLASSPAAAQTPSAPDVCFQQGDDHDPSTTDDLIFRCAAELPQGPNYLQGDIIDIRLRDVRVPATVRVRCLTDCHETEGRSYLAAYTPGQTLRFPRDFNERPGSSAVADRAPRYNSSWEAVVLVQDTPVARAVFNVWLFDRWLSPNLAVMPGERHIVRAAGFDEGANVQMRVERRSANGTFVTVATFPGALATIPGGGFDNRVFMPNAWTLLKQEALNIRECGEALDDCYRFVVKGAGKDDERVPFRVSPALLKPDYANSVGNGVDGSLRPAPPTIGRTSEILVAVDLRYPGGRSFQGPRLLEEDVAPGPITKEPSLRVRVERVNATGALPVQEVPMRFNQTAQRWEGRWTIPKDFPVRSAEPEAHYRLRLLPDQDRHGNRIPDLTLANYTIERARLLPVLVTGFESLGRTEEANFSFAVRYLNGTPVTPEDLKTPLRGCFVRESQGEPFNCAGVNLTEGAYANGLWAFKVRYPRDYPHLETHRFHLMRDTEDRWGNVVNATSSGPFRVVAGSPRIEFDTVLRGRELTVLERGGGYGNYVSVQATITYADGAPFNHYLTVDQSTTLLATLTKRGPAGAIASQVDLPLREVDASSGRWMGDLWLTADDAQTPLGTWTFRLDVRDNLTVPNANVSEFHREIVGIPLVVDPLRQPYPTIETEATQGFRFRVLYQDGNEVPRGDLLDNLYAYVHRYNPANATAFGAPVSGRLVPQYDPSGGWYHVEFKVPVNLFSGTYVFVVTGGDRFGNRLSQDAYSREFSTTSRTLERPVLTQPPKEVRRGESATVVFDAREGDVGLAGTGAPLVGVERFDAGTMTWVVERRDLRQSAPDLQDHVGLFPVTATTSLGVYRFTFEGRDANLQRVVSVSENFSILPTEVPRALLAPPPDRVVKGASFSFSIERLDGDRFVDAVPLFNGRARPVVNGFPLQLPPPVVVAVGSAMNVTWEIPFDAPLGNYSLRLMGLDLYGNAIEVLAPAVEVHSAQLTGRVLGSPARTIARGEEATLLFGITYPKAHPSAPDTYYVGSQVPVVNVRNESGVVGRADVRSEGLTYVATWTPPPNVGVGDYSFEVTGSGAGGNAFPPLRSSAFRIVPGTVVREPVADVGASVERMTTVIFSIPFDARDRYAEFQLLYFGASTDASAALFGTREPQTVTPLAHSLETDTGRYVARFVTDQRTAPGLYRIVAQGEDGFGNRIESKSNPFVLSTTSIILVPDPTPPDEAFREGVPITISFVARYRAGSVMDDTHGRPSVVVLYTAPGQQPLPVTDRPELEYRDGRWYATWTPPEILPEGVYEFSFGGVDGAGNVIGSSKSRAYVVTSTLGGSAAKLLPAPGAEAVVLALGVVAMALARRRAA